MSFERYEVSIQDAYGEYTHVFFVLHGKTLLDYSDGVISLTPINGLSAFYSANGSKTFNKYTGPITDPDISFINYYSSDGVNKENELYFIKPYTAQAYINDSDLIEIVAWDESAVIYFRWDDEAWQEYVEPLVNRKGVLWWYADDGKGNISQQRSFNFSVVARLKDIIGNIIAFKTINNQQITLRRRENGIWV